jgi:AcrR family transcriptional regulator
MRSTQRPIDDLTTRAKIRDAAIAYFGSHGFSKTTVRAIAEKAGVSPGLVIHHFGSKDGLRGACDAYVTALIDEQTQHAASQLAPADMLAMLARRPEFAIIAPYLTTALIEGGEFADRLMGRLVADMETYLGAAVAAGIARPTGDERARAEMVTLFKLGILTFASQVAPSGTAPEDILQSVADRLTIPALELFTFGLYTSSDYLDAYRALSADPTGSGSSRRSHRKGDSA